MKEFSVQNTFYLMIQKAQKISRFTFLKSDGILRKIHL